MRNDTKVLEVVQGYKIKKHNEQQYLLEHPQGSCARVSEAFMQMFIEKLETDSLFRDNFYTKDLNYLPLDDNSDNRRPDRTSIGFLEGYEVIKFAESGVAFIRTPSGAYFKLKIDVMRHLVLNM